MCLGAFEAAHGMQTFGENRREHRRHMLSDEDRDVEAAPEFTEHAEQDGRPAGGRRNREHGGPHR